MGLLRKLEDLCDEMLSERMITKNRNGRNLMAKFGLKIIFQSGVVFCVLNSGQDGRFAN